MSDLLIESVFDCLQTRWVCNGNAPCADEDIYEVLVLLNWDGGTYVEVIG